MWDPEKWCWRTYLQGGKRDADVENRPEDTVWEGESGTSWENSNEAYTSLCVKYTARGKLLCNKGSSTQCDTYRVWDGGGGVGREHKRRGIYAYLCLTHAVVWQKSTQHCKAITLRLKINLKNKIKHSMIQQFFLKVSFWRIKLPAIPAGKGSVASETAVQWEDRGFFFLFVCLFFQKRLGRGRVQTQPPASPEAPWILPTPIILLKILGLVDPLLYFFPFCLLFPSFYFLWVYYVAILLA